MRTFAPIQTAQHLVRAFLLLVWIMTLASYIGTLAAQDHAKTKSKAPPVPTMAAETAREFLGYLDQGDVNAAIALWAANSVNDKLKPRLEKMAAKVKKAGGIKKVDAEPCEERRIKKFEEQTGEKIDVVPVEIICGDESLMLAVFSMRNKEGASRIFQLESLKEWGGTASLDDELAYSH